MFYLCIWLVQRMVRVFWTNYEAEWLSGVPLHLIGSDDGASFLNQLRSEVTKWCTFASDWFKGWGEFSEPITKRSDQVVYLCIWLVQMMVRVFWTNYEAKWLSGVPLHLIGSKDGASFLNQLRSEVTKWCTFASELFRMWCKFSGAIIKRIEVKPMQPHISFDSHL